MGITFGSAFRALLLAAGIGLAGTAANAQALNALVW
jgi:hypothetical protein